MMKKHGLRRFFSLLLAVIMVCALLPTAALAEDTTGDGETQPKAVVVDEDGKTQKRKTPRPRIRNKAPRLPTVMTAIRILTTRLRRAKYPRSTALA